jgi:hypothetical protein
MAVKTYAGNVSPYDGTEYILVRASGVITLLHIGQAANFTSPELDFLDDDFIFTDGGVISDTILYEAIYSSSTNPADGDILYRAGSRFRNLNPGAPGTILQVSSLGDPEWASITDLAGLQGPPGPDSRTLFTAKGQLLAGTGTGNGTTAGGTVAPAPASNGQVLVSDNTLTGGIKWENPSTVSTDVDPATNVIQGVVRLSTAAASSADPIAVGDNDTRMTNARTPTTHTHAQSEVTNLTADLAARQITSQKGIANGYAGLGADGKVPPAQGGFAFPVRTVTAGTAVTSADSVLNVNNSSPATITLPASSTMTVPLTINRLTTSTATVTITPNGAQTIDGDAQLVLVDAGTSATLMPISTGWKIHALTGVIDTSGSLPATVTPSMFTTKGDLPVATGPGAVVRQGVGTDGQVLTADSTQSTGVRWTAAPGGGVLASNWAAKGDLVAGASASNPQRLAIGTDGQVLVADSAQTLGMRWAAAPTSGITATTVDAKGDLIAGTAADTVGRQGVGTDGTLLIADSTQSTGMRWAQPYATSSTEGTARLSVAAVSSTNPIVVGTNDPRMYGIPSSTKTGSYTLIAGDAGTVVEANSASDIAITVPPSVFGNNTWIRVDRLGGGNVYFLEGSGVTIRSPGGAKHLRTQYSSAVLRQRGSTNEWMLYGDIVLGSTGSTPDVGYAQADHTGTIIDWDQVLTSGEVATGQLLLVHGISFSNRTFRIKSDTGWQALPGIGNPVFSDGNNITTILWKIATPGQSTTIGIETVDGTQTRAVGQGAVQVVSLGNIDSSEFLEPVAGPMGSNPFGIPVVMTPTSIQGLSWDPVTPSSPRGTVLYLGANADGYPKDAGTGLLELNDAVSGTGVSPDADFERSIWGGYVNHTTAAQISAKVASLANGISHAETQYSIAIPVRGV